MHGWKWSCMKTPSGLPVHWTSLCKSVVSSIETSSSYVYCPSIEKRWVFPFSEGPAPNLIEHEYVVHSGWRQECVFYHQQVILVVILDKKPTFSYHKSPDASKTKFTDLCSVALAADFLVPCHHRNHSGRNIGERVLPYIRGQWQVTLG